MAHSSPSPFARAGIRRAPRRIGIGALLLALAAAPGCGPARSGAARTADPPSQPSAPCFRDIAERSGLAAFQQVDGSSGRKYFVEQLGSGCAIFDYDGDGKQDLYFCSGTALPGYRGQSTGNRLFHNRGDGTFEDATARAGVACGRYSLGVAAADYDNDGLVDLYVCCYGPNVLYRNNGDGTFADVTAKARVGDPRLSASAAWGDYNGDGYLDLYVANYVRWKLAEDRWCSKTGGPKSYCGPRTYEPERHTLYRNNRDGTFTDVTAQAGIAGKSANGLGVIWLDYDEDGRMDLFVANDQIGNFLWRNNGDGTFSDRALAAGVGYGEEGNARAGMGVDAGDYDNDGRLDLLVTNFSQESYALYHNETGAFRDLAAAAGIGAATLRYLGFGTGFLDYDRDGRLDVFFANGHVLDDIETYSDVVTWAQPNQLFRNQGDGSFEDVSAATGIGAGQHVSRGAAFGDLDSDGRPDIVVSVLRGRPLYLHNECAPAAHWLGLELRAARGNPQAVGATVWLSAGGVRQRRDVRAGGSYASSSDARLLFGLGRTTRVEELKIRWPDGHTEVKTGLPIDRYTRVDEQSR